MKPNYVVSINGVRYEYTAGTIQDVPQPVYAAIQHYYEMHPQENPPETDEEMIRRICGEMIAESKPTEYRIDLSGIELSSTVTDLENAFPKSIFDEITGAERPVQVRLAINYDSEYLETVGYTVSDENLHFVFPHATDGAVDALIDVCVFCPNKIVKATLNVTDLG